GVTPLTVNFNDASTSYDGIISWIWDFDDGTTSNEQNPTHVFTVGSYTVTLTVYEEDEDSNLKSTIITVVAPPNKSPKADFIIESSDPASPNESILFEDNSEDTDGDIVSWFWIFGDGSSSTAQNPIHVYEETGTFNVILTVKDDDGATNNVTKQIIIQEVTPPVSIHDYDGLWFNSNFRINLTATDDYSGVLDTFYIINDGQIQRVSVNGQPLFTEEGSNNTLEYWSEDKAGNIEDHHVLLDIKLDKTPPIANAGYDFIIDEDSIIIFQGNNSTDNIQITDYTWTVDGENQQLNGLNPQYIFHSPGNYNVSLEVTDAALNSAYDSINIVVNDVTQPTANAGDDVVVNQDELVNFDGSNSLDNVEVTSYVWEFDDNLRQVLHGMTTSYSFASPGIYEITLTVEDAKGNFDTDVLLVTVLDTAWPVANAGPDQIIDANSWGVFDGSASSDNVGIESFTWTFMDGSLQILQGMNPRYYFEIPNNYEVTLTVTDAEGYSSNDTIMVVVRDSTAPNIEVENYQNAIEDNPILFDASKSYDNIGIVDFSWSFGDNTFENSSGSIVEHIYSEPGIYNVELRVKDFTGNVNSTIITLVVHRDTDGDLLADYLDDDDDADGMSDEWELNHRLDPLDPSDALLDSDGDGVNNLHEFELDTDPTGFEFEGHILSIVLVVAVIFSSICYVLFFSRSKEKK
ncbi:MAG: PKD domain-containing protein, partial [Candidatus Bathyarchaeota archaeon]